MKEKIEPLSKEIKDLKKQLETKERELNILQKAESKARQDRRDTNAEQKLAGLLKNTFNQEFTVVVDPEGSVRATVWLRHSASPKINNILGPMTDNKIKIKNSTDYTEKNHLIKIAFPYEKLQSVCDGLVLSAGVDLNEDRARFEAKC